jgi:hypothetical protein
MVDPDQLTDGPVCYTRKRGRVDLVSLDVAPYMSNSPLASHRVHEHQRTGNHRSQRLRRGGCRNRDELAALIGEIRNLGAKGSEGCRQSVLKQPNDNLTELAGCKACVLVTTFGMIAL